MADLLPPASTPLERAFAMAAARIGDIPVDVATLINPATCDITALPWLGWMLSVDRWDADWGDDQKREAVAGAIAAQRIKGTRLAVEQALQALDDLLQLVEWFEASPHLPRHTFEVRLPLIDADGVAGGKRVSAEFARQIIADVTRAKPARSHFALVQQLELIGLAAAAGVQLRVFCASLADVFDNQVPPEWRADLWQLIEATPNLTWMLLTKRPQNVAKMLPRMVFPDPERIPANVAIGTTAEDQERADQRLWPLAIIAEVTGWQPFVSAEPLLGELDLTRIVIPGTRAGRFNALNGNVAVAPIHVQAGQSFLGRMNSLPPLKLVITGGESGSNARPSHPDWFRQLRDQCAAAGVPFHFKQWGEWAPSDADAQILECFGTSQSSTAWPNRTIAHGTSIENGGAGIMLNRVGAKRAGRHLDGVIHNAMLGETRP